MLCIGTSKKCCLSSQKADQLVEEPVLVDDVRLTEQTGSSSTFLTKILRLFRWEGRSSVDKKQIQVKGDSYRAGNILA